MKKKNKPVEITGRYQSSGKGYGFLIREDGGEDLFLPPRAEGGAWHNDLVAALPDNAGCSDGMRHTAAVTRILERANSKVTGTVFRQGREVWLAPDSDRLPPRIRVTGRKAGLRDGDRAAVTMTAYSAGKKGVPMGALDEVFGRSGSRDAIVAAILYNYGINPDFSPEGLAEADRTPDRVSPGALPGRLDLREKAIFTIDGESAKDLDDAVSLERDEYGRPVLGVHIADVSHYVSAGSALDIDAWNRGTSVYYADRAVPMLPPALSNGICSLNAGADRLALSCFMVIGKRGEVVEHTLTKSVIRSKLRMTYEACNLLLAGGTPDDRYAPFLPILRDMAGVASVLKKRRLLRGALELETREVYIRCDPAGAPVEVEERVQGESESLIEEFMLIANETVAERLALLGSPAVYRVHEKPSQEKTDALRALLAPLGYALTDSDSFSLQKVLRQAEKTPHRTLIHMMVLRSLMKAHYDSNNLGHFGLAAEYYCHFTAPIRRYPDLITHRAVTALLEGGGGKKLSSAVKKAALQSSEREVAAAGAERETEKCYLAEYMQGHIGEQFHGIVSGVARTGLFVTLSNGVEGFVPVHSLPDDSYDFDQVHLRLSGAITKAVFAFGMEVTAVCVSADPAAGQINLSLVFSANMG